MIFKKKSKNKYFDITKEDYNMVIEAKDEIIENVYNELDVFREKEEILINLGINDIGTLIEINNFINRVKAYWNLTYKNHDISKLTLLDILKNIGNFYINWQDIVNKYNYNNTKGLINYHEKKKY